MKLSIRSTALAFAVALSGTLAAAPASAQISLEGRGSLQYPTGDFGDGAKSEAGLGLDVFFNVSPALSIYAGYTRDQFGCDQCGNDDGWSTNGLEAGAKLLFAREGSILPWARVGGVWQRLEIDADGSEANSDRELGLQVSGGLDIPLGEVLSFSPAIRYQTWTADFEPVPGLITAEQEVSFLALDLGLHVHLGH